MIKICEILFWTWLLPTFDFSTLPPRFKIWFLFFGQDLFSLQGPTNYKNRHPDWSNSTLSLPLGAKIDEQLIKVQLSLPLGAKVDEQLIQVQLRLQGQKSMNNRLKSNFVSLQGQKSMKNWLKSNLVSLEVQKNMKNWFKIDKKSAQTIIPGIWMAQMLYFHRRIGGSGTGPSVHHQPHLPNLGASCHSGGDRGGVPGRISQLVDHGGVGGFLHFLHLFRTDFLSKMYPTISEQSIKHRDMCSVRYVVFVLLL